MLKPSRLSTFAAALLLAWPACADLSAPASPTTRAAISALYVANDAAQRAITIDICEDEHGSYTLDREALRQYNHVMDALGYAYEASAGSDEALEQVDEEFCAWASER